MDWDYKTNGHFFFNDSERGKSTCDIEFQKGHITGEFHRKDYRYLWDDHFSFLDIDAFFEKIIEIWRCYYMAVIIDSFRLPKDIQALTIDSDKPKHSYNAYRIADEIFNIVPVYDSDRIIAIQDSRDFVGKTVEFVMA